MNRKNRRALTEEDKAFLREHLWEKGVAWCGKQMGRSVSTLYPNVKRLGLKNNPIHQFNNFDISHITALKDPFVIYFLGYFWADGTITSEKRHRIKFKIAKRDFDALHSHIHRLGAFWNYNEYSDANRPNWQTMSVLEITDRGLWNFLNQYDYRIKSLASADKILAAISSELRHYWWRGYFDGDGCASIGRGRRLCFDSGYAQDWTFVQKLGQELDINFTIERVNRGTRAGSKAGISNYIYVKRFTDYIYQGEVFGLTRKRERLEAQTKVCPLKPQKGRTSQYRGVSYDARRRTYRMQISSHRKFYYKDVKTEIEGAQEYDKLARVLFGNKAILNFP